MLKSLQLFIPYTILILSDLHKLHPTVLSHYSGTLQDSVLICLLFSAHAVSYHQDFFRMVSYSWNGLFPIHYQWLDSTYPLRLRNGVISARNPSLIPPKQDYAPLIHNPTTLCPQMLLGFNTLQNY